MLYHNKIIMKLKTFFGREIDFSAFKIVIIVYFIGHGKLFF